MLNNIYYNFKKSLLVLMIFTMVTVAFAENKHVKPTKQASVAETTQATENLAEAKVQPADVLDWANRAVTAIFSYNYKNYNKTIANNAQYLTPGAWKKYNAHLQSTGNAKTLTEHQITVIATVTKPSKIVNQGVVNGRYSWTVEVPMHTRYETADPKKTINQEENFLVTLQIVRMSSEKHPSGIAINSLLQQPVK